MSTKAIRSLNRSQLTELSIFYLGHGAFAMSDGSATVLIDPFFSGQFVWKDVTERHLDAMAVPLSDIRDCQAILVSHEHGDHYDPQTLAALLKQTQADIHTPGVVAEMARADGLPTRRIKVVDRGQSFAVGTMTVTIFASAYEAASPAPAKRVGFLVTSGERGVYHQGDSHGVDPSWSAMKGRIDALIMWPYRVAEAVYTLNPPVILFHHMDRFTPGDFHCNRDVGLELLYHSRYFPQTRFIAPPRGGWISLASLRGQR